LYNPPKTTDKCDKCGADLYIRADDNAETVKNRLQTYHDTTEPIADFYAAKGKLIRVDGQGAVEDITARVFAALESLEA
jgi:adenylate kinase